MIFQECTAYKLINFSLNQSKLNSSFNEFAFTPAHETSRFANGFISPISERPDELVVQVQHVLGFRLRFDEKKVPSKKVVALTDKRVAEIEAKGQPVTKQLRSDIKENAEKDLLKFELPSSKFVSAIIDTKTGWIYLNSKSAPVCESALSLIRKALGSFRVLPATTKSSPSHALCNSLCTEASYLANGLEIDICSKIKAVGKEASHKVTFEGVEIGEHELEVLSGTDIVQADLVIKEEFDNAQTNCWSFTFTTQKGVKPFALSKLNYAPKTETDFSPYEEKTDIDFLADLLISANLLSMVFTRLGESFGGYVDFEDFAKKGVTGAELKMEKRGSKTLSAATISEVANQGLPDGMTATLVEGSLKSVTTVELSRYEQAKKLVISEGRVGVAMLQRHFKIGYNTAERLVEELEVNGVVSVPDDKWARTVISLETK